MKNNKITNTLLILSVATLIFGSGYKLGQYRQVYQNSSSTSLIAAFQAEAKDKNIDTGLFWDAWNKLQEKFVDKSKINTQKMFYGAIKGMVASADDPYTFFLTPEENREIKNDLGGKFEGIGAQLGMKDGHVVIIAPLKSSPAEKAGIRPGDYVLKVNNDDTKGWSLFQAVSKIRGDKGTKVKLTLLRGEKEFTVEVTRDQIKVASVELSYEKTVAYLKLNQFGENTNDEWDKAVSDIQNKWRKKQIKGMILDLRGNPGGYLDSAVYLAAEFLAPGRVVVKQESANNNSHTYYVTRNGKLQDIPLTVLIDKGSASSSEILTGALRDYKRAKLIGEKSFGKGSVQEAIDLKNNAGLHITVAKWVLPNGDWIMGKGIEPDISVQNDIKEGNTLSKEGDRQLEKAIEVVLQ
ncbi:S41 family peptidase [Candidatus Roizmanbacteria bacterium]|nr:S41 family peptidase [Candidatus Roizmanbacteria bacterium]